MENTQSSTSTTNLKTQTQTCENCTTTRLSRVLLVQIYSRYSVLTGCWQLSIKDNKWKETFFVNNFASSQSFFMIFFKWKIAVRSIWKSGKQFFLKMIILRVHWYLKGHLTPFCACAAIWFLIRRNSFQSCYLWEKSSSIDLMRRVKIVTPI